ncbi:MAG: Lrp/AsnC family transcriptional regulator [Thermoplasmata archaeon]|nr:Lrp/AsnC family transcriptional regulator [Thermoplasmata archaeon]
MIDKLDLKIINVLNKNARTSFREISRKLKVSLTTVANRVKKLEGEGIIKGYIPLIDLDKLGYDLLTIIGVRIQHGKLMEVERKISKDPHVYEIYDTTGDWDSIIIARFRSRDELNSFIKNVLAEEDVERTITYIVLNVVKDEKRAQI